MIGLLRVIAGDEPVVVDLGSGPGSLAGRILDRLPGARVVAVDGDPLLLEMGRRGIGDRGGRLTWVAADLRAPGWELTLGVPGKIDAAMSTTALHWMAPEDTVRLCRTLAGIIRPGGVFLNGDHMTFDRGLERISAAAGRLRREPLEAPRVPAPESWTAWWEAVEADPTLASLVAARRERWGGHPDHSSPGEASFWQAALIRAGFSEAAVVWQRLEDRVVAGIR